MPDANNCSIPSYFDLYFDLESPDIRIWLLVESGLSTSQRIDEVNKAGGVGVLGKYGFTLDF